MAALIKHVLSKQLPRRYYGTAPVPTAQITSIVEKIKARGFLRELKDYTPPTDVDTRLSVLCDKVLGASANSPDYQITEPEKRFQLLSECFKEFNHGIPNSLLYIIRTVGDLYEFYRTPVDTTAPYDALKRRQDLPENLHLVPDYLRFHPDTDSLFKGKTAFPQSSTLVTGLRTRKKYQGLDMKSPYDDM